MTFLQRPYPIDKSVSRILLISALFGLFVFVFLRLFEPFGIHELLRGKTVICLFFGAWCAFAVLFLNFGVVRLLPRWFDESRWTVGKELLWVTLHCALIGIGNTFVAIVTGLTQWSWNTLFTYEIYTVAVGIFPITISVLLTELRLKRQYEAASGELNTHLPNPKKEQTMKTVTLPSDNRNEDLTVATTALICLEAADNYVTVYHHADAGNVCKTVLRSTLKAQEEQLSGIGTFFRAHKSYVVNCTHIERVSGNAQGYRLHLRGMGETVPVSRKQNEALRKRLAALN